VEQLKRAIRAFKSEFQTSEGESLVVNEAEPDAMAADEVGQEKVKRYQRPKVTAAGERRG
jgi:hypothetical protein